MATLRMAGGGGAQEVGGSAVEVDMDAIKGKLLDGKAMAREVREEVREQAEELARTSGVQPGLAVVIVGAARIGFTTGVTTSFTSN